MLPKEALGNQRLTNSAPRKDRLFPEFFMSVANIHMFDDADVVEIRTRFATDDNCDLKSLTTELGITRRAVRYILTGRTHASCPGAIPDDHPKLRRWENQIIAQRKAVIASKGRRKASDVSAALGVSIDVARNLLSGKTYSDLPNVVPKTMLCPPEEQGAPVFTDEEVISLRERVRAANGAITIPQLVAELGRSHSSIQLMLTGKTFRDLPGAVSMLDFHLNRTQISRKRDFPDEVVLFMRLAYKDDVVTVQKIASAFGKDVSVVRRMISGESYKNVPMPVAHISSRAASRRKLTPQQVIWARQVYRDGVRSVSKISKLFKLNTTAIEHMIFGRTYKELPGIVPSDHRPFAQVPASKRKKKKAPMIPQKMRIEHLRDHDSRLYSN
jgi:hypothetical protein